MARTTHISRRARFQLVAVAVTGALLAAGCTSNDDPTPNSDGEDVGQLPQGALDAMDDPGFTNARWSLQVSPIDDGDPVYALAPDAISGMGSNMKLFSVGTWLETYGADATLTTPVFAVGDRTGDTLDGELVLRASGDLVMGGRNAGSGELGYSVPPQPDANGLPGAKPAPGDPLAGLDDLAAQVAASGITSIDGDVVVDDRLFETWNTYDVEISPIVINDNLVAVVTTPGTEGSPATIEMIPDTSAFTIVNQVETAAAGGDTSVDITPELDDAGEPTNTLVVAGTVAADSDPLLNVYEVPDPASVRADSVHRGVGACRSDHDRRSLGAELDGGSPGFRRLLTRRPGGHPRFSITGGDRNPHLEDLAQLRREPHRVPPCGPCRLDRL